MSTRPFHDSRKLPPFTANGVLPAGDYELTLSELRRSKLVRGPGGRKRSPDWDVKWRRHLADNLAVLVNQLWNVGITRIFVDGSFVEDNDHPQDIDGYFECDLTFLASGRLERELNRLDPHQIWTWDPAKHRSAAGFSKRQLPIWHQYRVELYPHVGQLTGIRDLRGNELEFPTAFRLTRSGIPKGILQIVQEQ